MASANLIAPFAERVGIVETKVENIEEKLDDLKISVKEMHDCLDQTRDLIAEKLEKMQIEYRANSSKFFEHSNDLHELDNKTHFELSEKIKSLEGFKTKWVYTAAGAIAALGWASGHASTILKMIGS